MKDEKELKERWRKLLKFNVLFRLYTELDLQEKTESNPAGALTKTMAELEQDARVKVMKTYDDWLKRMDKMDQDDRRSMFLNVITNIYDPHTGYFPPADKENFDIQMSGQLEGIGATLQEKDGYIQVAAIVPGSACYRQGELAEDDIILKVAQGKEEPVDIVDMRVDDAVKYIRGPKRNGSAPDGQENRWQHENHLDHSRHRGARGNLCPFCDDQKQLHQ